MNIAVTKENLEEILYKLNSLNNAIIGLDSETTGLTHKDRLFSIQIGILGEDLYHFNFNAYPLEQNAPILDKKILCRLHTLWQNPNIRWVIFNAKFDMRMLDYEGIILAGEVYDPMIGAHIEYNKHFSYSLDNCLKRIGFSKNDEVALYIKDHRLYTNILEEGKKTKTKLLHFEKVPYSIMFKYSLEDVIGMLKLYEHQMEYFSKDENKEQMKLILNNMELIKAVYSMEREGIYINQDYCKAGQENALAKVAESVRYIESLADKQFANGPKWLKEVLNAQDVELELSEKGNPILSKAKLKSMDNAVAHHIMEMRNYEKEAGFYATFPRFADTNSYLHPNYRLTGTDTGRFSCSEPNLQQVPKEDKAKDTQLFTVRGAFEAGEDFIFVSLDFDQMEYRVMADYANEKGMIEAIKGGLDPHTYVANMMGVDRKLAKTLNFGLLFGMGIGKLAIALGVEEQEARNLKWKYYSELPNVQRLVRQIQDTAIGRGYIKNKYGRRYFLDDPKWAYKMTNYLIQGSCADVVRHIIPKISNLLSGKKSAMILQIHDEILIRLHKKETYLVPEIKKIMEDEYVPLNGMNLTCGCEWSPSSWRTTDFKDWSTYVQ